MSPLRVPDTGMILGGARPPHIVWRVIIIDNSKKTNGRQGWKGDRPSERSRVQTCEPRIGNRASRPSPRASHHNLTKPIHGSDGWRMQQWGENTKFLHRKIVPPKHLNGREGTESAKVCVSMVEDRSIGPAKHAYRPSMVISAADENPRIQPEKGPRAVFQAGDHEMR